jgi:ABC-type multidrug transport system ATPase subunit
MAAAVLQLDRLRFAHDGEAPLFDGLSFTLGPGLHWLQGESGSGKTTLLRLLAGDLPCTGSRRLHGLAFERDPAAWRRAVAWVDARDPAFDDLTPVALRDRLRQQHPALDDAAWQRHINGFGLAEHGFKTLHMLSTGMRRTAALAAQLASGCALLLLDEPGAGLDQPAMRHLVQSLAALGQQAGCAVLMACGAWPAGLARDSEIVLPWRAPARRP